MCVAILDSSKPAAAYFTFCWVIEEGHFPATKLQFQMVVVQMYDMPSLLSACVRQNVAVP